MGLRQGQVEISLNPLEEQELPGWEIYRGGDSPLAMVRAQQRLELPWVLEKIRRHIGYRAQILDLGCGHGSFSNELAQRGHSVTAVDGDPEALNIAKVWDKTQSVRYRLGDISKLPFPSKSFDVVTALDVLCHTDHCLEVLHEATRVLKPGGVFIFDNFNHSARAWLLAVKGPEWFIKNTPPEYHKFAHFQKPQALARHLRRAGLDVVQVRGLRPAIFQTAMVKLLFSGTVSDGFQFHFCRKPWLSYVGLAKKRRFY